MLCEICNKEMKGITNTHLKYHNMSMSDYKIKYPNSKMVWSEGATKDNNSSLKMLSEKIKKSYTPELKRIKAIKATKYPEKTTYCATCNKELESKHNYIKYYHKYCSCKCKYIGQKIKRMSHNCKNCGVEFFLRPCEHKRLYCSRKCGVIGRTFRKLIKKKCEKCQKIFNTKRHNQIYCSRKCSIKLDTLQKECEGCNTIFYTKKQERLYCSIKCFQKHTLPNRPEKFLISLIKKYNLPITYVGDNKRKVIEIFGLYWHNDKEVVDKINYYNDEGYDICCLLNTELQERSGKLLDENSNEVWNVIMKLTLFVNDHTSYLPTCNQFYQLETYNYVKE